MSDNPEVSVVPTQAEAIFRKWYEKHAISDIFYGDQKAIIALITDALAHQTPPATQPTATVEMLRNAMSEAAHRLDAGVDKPSDIAGDLYNALYYATLHTPPPVATATVVDDEALDPHLPDSIKSERRCGIQRSDWITGWFVPWSPRNDNQNAEGPWSHWVALARNIIAADEKARAALAATPTPPAGGQ